MKAKHAFTITTQVEITLALENAAKSMEETIAKFQGEDAELRNAKHYESFWQEQLAKVQAALAEFNDAKISA